MDRPDSWVPERYARHADFVPALGDAILRQLNPQPGERVLDIGCGDGVLTEALVARGATVVGVDGSPAMVEAARARGLQVVHADAQRLPTTAPFDVPFDAVFSNAALHWMPDADGVLAGVVRVLRPGGRFVAELGALGNVAAIATALRAALATRGLAPAFPWYFPAPDIYADRMRRAGLEVDDVTVFPRPTPLPTDMDGWLETFAGSILAQVPEAERGPVRAATVALLRPALCDERGRWVADYVRLRVAAHRPR